LRVVGWMASVEPGQGGGCDQGKGGVIDGCQKQLHTGCLVRLTKNAKDARCSAEDRGRIGGGDR
jgi:hypothetical protein